MVKNLPSMQESQVWSWPLPSRGQEDPLEKGKATHSRILACRIPRTVETMGSQRAGQDWATLAFTHVAHQMTSMLNCLVAALLLVSASVWASSLSCSQGSFQLSGHCSIIQVFMHIGNKLRVTGGEEGREGINQEYGSNRYTLLYKKA